MKRISIIACALCMLLMAGCKPNHDKQLANIRSHEDSLDVLTYAIDSLKGAEMIGLYVDFANNFPDDSLTPGFLFKASDIAMNIGDTASSITNLNRIIEQYTNYPDLPLCYFMKGQTYEAAEDFDKAREAYELYLELFPNHYLAADTRKMLPLVGLSSEEMLEFILQNAPKEELVAEAAQ